MHYTFTVGLVAAALAVAGLPAAANEPVAERDMLRYCQGEASAEFGVNPRRISMSELKMGKNASHAAIGTYESDSGKVAFRCRFDPKGRFKWVRTDDNAAAKNGKPSQKQVSACNDMELGKGKILETTGLKPGAYELIMAFSDGNYVCDVEADGKVTYFEKLR